MIQRSTFGQTTRTFLGDLHANSRMLDVVQHQLSTGKRISSPADDPVGITLALRIRQDQANVAAWRSTIDDSLTWLGATDAALDGATQVLQRARELAVQGANGTLTTTDRQGLAKEVRELASQMTEIGNTNFAGRYLFAGTATLSQPFDPVTHALNPAVNNAAISREVAAGSTISVNTTPAEFMGPGGATPDVFAVLATLANDLDASNLSGISSALTTLDTHIAHVGDTRGAVAGRTNRLETAASRMATVEIAAVDQLSKVEDVDMAEAITDLKTRESVLRASLGVGGRVLQPSLLDFLR